jgi:hypothetical protein
MRTPRKRWSALVLLVLVMSTSSEAAQATTGSIEGVVTDNQGLVVPGATVMVRNVETNVSRSLATGVDGSYRFLNMPVGNYELTVELTGFSRHVRAGITLAVNQVAVVDVQVRPAALTEVVEVTADAPLLNTANAEVGVRFDTQRGRAPGDGKSEHLHAGAFGAGRERTGERADQLRLRDRRGELLVERRAAAIEQRHDRRPGQQ